MVDDNEPKVIVIGVGNTTLVQTLLKTLKEKMPLICIEEKDCLEEPIIRYPEFPVEYKENKKKTQAEIWATKWDKKIKKRLK